VEDLRGARLDILATTLPPPTTITLKSTLNATGNAGVRIVSNQHARVEKLRESGRDTFDAK
jgi:hypothetical protein